jgi:hypothetical protein
MESFSVRHYPIIHIQNISECHGCAVTICSNVIGSQSWGASQSAIVAKTLRSLENFPWTVFCGFVFEVGEKGILGDKVDREVRARRERRELR